MRCYNGCPDKEYQAFLDDRELAGEQLAAIGAHATYFPMEGKWMVFRDLDALTGFHDTKRQAADAALSLEQL